MADVTGLSESITGVFDELVMEISSADTDKRFQPIIATAGLPTTSVSGLISHIIATNVGLTSLQLALNTKSDIRALEA